MRMGMLLLGALALSVTACMGSMKAIGTMTVVETSGDKPDWPCLRCLSSDSPVSDLLYGAPAWGAESTDAVAALFMGAQQTTEALKLIVAADEETVPKLLQCTFPAFHFTEHGVEKDALCSLCRPGLTRLC